VQILANFLVVGALVALHAWYFNKRTQSEPEFILGRGASGCLPIPSRTEYQTFLYGYTDAVSNQLPFGIVVSFAVATARLLSYSVGGRNLKASKTVRLAADATGALIVA
jgi:hypothetical protein